MHPSNVVVALAFDILFTNWNEILNSLFVTAGKDFPFHCVKSVQIRSFFWSVFSCIRTEYSKKRTRKNSLLGNFSRSVRVQGYTTEIPSLA